MTTNSTQVSASDDSIRTIVETDILELIGMNDRSEDEKQKLRTLIVETIQNRVAAHILDLLDRPSAHSWQKLLAEGDIQGADTFLNDKGVDIDDIAISETLTYKIQLLNQASVVYDNVLAKQPTPQSAASVSAE